jgi:hypothetical protein
VSKSSSESKSSPFSMRPVYQRPNEASCQLLAIRPQLQHESAMQPRRGGESWKAQADVFRVPTRAA